MHLPDTIQCKRCRSFLSHPLDHCPVCNDQFYWLVKTQDKVDPEAKMAFIHEMETFSGGGVTSDFLTHGGQLWLPHQFWTHSADGKVLEAFPWITALEHHQHDNPNNDWESHQNREAARLHQTAMRQQTVDDQPKPWETVPNMPLPDFEAMRAEREGQQQRPQPSTLNRRPRPKAAPKPKAPAAKPKKVAASQKEPFILSPGFRHVMVFIFFLCLSASYLVLRYHKNHMLPEVPKSSQSEPQTPAGDSP